MKKNKWLYSRLIDGVKKVQRCLDVYPPAIVDSQTEVKVSVKTTDIVFLQEKNADIRKNLLYSFLIFKKVICHSDIIKKAKSANLRKNRHLLKLIYRESEL